MPIARFVPRVQHRAAKGTHVKLSASGTRPESESLATLLAIALERPMGRATAIILRKRMNGEDHTVPCVYENMATTCFHLCGANRMPYRGQLMKKAKAQPYLRMRGKQSLLSSAYTLVVVH